MNEQYAGMTLAVLLIGLALFFAWRQWQTAGRLRREGDLADDERDFLLGQVRRRTVCCVCMVIFAGFLIGWFFLPPPPHTGDAAIPLSDADKNTLWLLAMYWLGALFVLVAILVLAAVDLLATLRFGVGQLRRLQHDQRALLLDALRQKSTANDAANNPQP